MIQSPSSFITTNTPNNNNNNIITTNNIKSNYQILSTHLGLIEQGKFDMKLFIKEFEQIPSAQINPKFIIKQIIHISQQRYIASSNQAIFQVSQKIIDWIYDQYCQKKDGIIEVFFFPSVQSESRLIWYLSQARKSILIAMFTLSNHNISNILRQVHEKGVEIRIITDDEFVERQGSDIIDLAKEGINIRTDEKRNALMHNKFSIIDELFVITGSYNWTLQGTNLNQENVIVIENPYAVSEYKKQFEILWKKYELKNFDKIRNTAVHNTTLYHNYIKKQEKMKQKEERKKLREEKAKKKILLARMKEMKVAKKQMLELEKQYKLIITQSKATATTETMAITTTTDTTATTAPAAVSKTIIKGNMDIESGSIEESQILPPIRKIRRRKLQILDDDDDLDSGNKSEVLTKSSRLFKLLQRSKKIQKVEEKSSDSIETKGRFKAIKDKWQWMMNKASMKNLGLYLGFAILAVGGYMLCRYR